ncbi:MAG: hypothetical protein NT080_00105 [Spirochaetes bacterium]|nr:hypothetical protein [Spirochaetota bacterium]
MDDREGMDGERARPGLARALFLSAVVLCAVVAAGTVYGLLSGSRARAAARDAANEAGVASGSAVYLGIGAIRAKTLDEPPAVVVASVSFPYDASSREFKEELFGKRDALRKACESFFASKKAEELHPAFLGRVKAGLRDALNDVLSLGKVETVWFGDYSVIR